MATTAAAAGASAPSPSAFAPAPTSLDPTTTTASALTQRQADSYMGELLSYSLERLQSEPRVLSEEAARLDRHAQQAAVANYRAFLDGSDALSAAQLSLKNSLQKLDELLEQGVAGLSAACEQFAQTAAHTIAAGSANKALLASQPALLDLLEAPSLAEACVRGGCYDEALELQAFVARLAMLHPELPVARALKQKMDKVNVQMLEALLARLRSSSLTLPECLRLVGYLRRAPPVGAAAAASSSSSSSFSSHSQRWRVAGIASTSADDEEAELRLQFLRCRDEWLAGLVRDLELEMGAGAAAGAGAGAAGATTTAAASSSSAPPSLEPYGGRAAEYVKRLIDLHRLHLFDIVMQYRAVFGDGTATTAATAAVGAAGATTTSSGAGGATTTTTTTPPPSRSGAVLPSWLSHRVGELVESLSRALPHVSDGASLASAMEHAAYAGASLGRVGSDYTAQLAPVFESCSLRLFGAYLGAAGDAFRARLESHRWIALAGKAGGAKAAATTAADGAGPSSSDGGAAAALDSSALVPPAALMEHPPVAVLVNGVLAALNELRHCATWGSRAPCGRALQSTLDGAALAMVSFSHSHPLPEGEMQQFRAAARMLADVAAPFLVACFSRVFAATGAAAVAGVGGTAGGGGGSSARHHQHHHPEVRSIKAVLAEIIEA
jgi:hypothetical protein